MVFFILQALFFIFLGSWLQPKIVLVERTLSFEYTIKKGHRNSKKIFKF